MRERASFPGRYGRAFVAALRRFNDKNGWVMSSHVAMSMMLALFPFILFVVALAGVIYKDVNTDDLLEVVFGSWPDDVAQPIVYELKNVLSASSTRLMTLGGLFALWFASNGVEAVRVALSEAYFDQDNRPFWQTRLISVALVLAGGAALLVAAVVELWIPLYTTMLQQAVPGEMTSKFTGIGLSWVVILAAPVLAVLTCHLVLPGQRHSVGQVLPGVILTLLLWAIAGWGFSVYIARFASYSATYAGLAGAMSALIFLYLNSAILIIGAEFNGALLGVGDSAGKVKNNA